MMHPLPILGLTALLFGAFPSHAAPESGARDPWTAHDPRSAVRVDHRDWQDFLDRYLDAASAPGVHRVRYGAVTGEDRNGLEAYLSRLQGVRVSGLNRREQKAYWINLYNAKTVAVVLRHHPVKSIRDIHLSGGRPGQGPWDAGILEVEGRKLSLNDVEHRILRPLWKDPLVHFGLNCASLGCPDLAASAYTAENTGRLLEKGARDFIRSPRGAEFADGTLFLSSIFDWYRGDFGEDEKELLAFLSRHAGPALEARLRRHSGRIRYRYDWALNEAAPR